MKNNFKRLLTLILCFLMLLSTAVFTVGCGEEEKEAEEETQSKKVVSLNMYIVTEDETEQKQALEVQKAINEITLKKLKAKVKINYITADEYADVLETKIEEVELFKSKDKPSDEKKDKEDAEGATEENIDDEENVEPEENPAQDASAENGEVDEEFTLDQELDQLLADGDVILENPQIDIIVFNNFELYRSFVSRGYLAPLDEYLNLTSKALRSYIYPLYFDAARLNTEMTYGVPVNGQIGDYEYFVFDKALAAKYGVNINSMNTLESLAPYLATIKANEPGVIPLEKGVAPRDYEFFGSDGSPIGIYNPNAEGEWASVLLPTYEDEKVLNHYRLINTYRKSGYLPDVDAEINEDTRIAVRVMSGSNNLGASIDEMYGDIYDAVLYKTPILTNANALTGVFSVASLSSNKAVAMQLIKEFNMNSELANLLQWGIENVHYYMADKDDGMGTIHVVENCGYVMNNRYTGNTYIKYRPAGTPYEFEAYKAHNLDVMVGAIGGFNPVLLPKDEESLRLAGEIGLKYYPELIGGLGDYDELIEKITDELGDVYADGSFERFISHKIGGDFYKYADYLVETYPGGTQVGVTADMGETVPDNTTEANN